MPSATRTEVFDVPARALFEVLVDYASYSEFVDHVRDVRVLSREGNHCQARFTVQYIREFQYTLDLYEEPYKKLWWRLASGDLFSQMDGHWKLKQRGKNKTEVEYCVDVAGKIAAPSFIVKQLVSQSLPRMMQSFYERTRSLSE